MSNLLSRITDELYADLLKRLSRAAADEPQRRRKRRKRRKQSELERLANLPM